MYSVDEKILQAYASDSREIYVKATFNNNTVVIGDKIKSFTVTDSIGNTDSLSLGNVCSKKLELDMFVPDNLTSIAKAKIEIEVGIDIDGTIAYTSLGIFYVDDYKTTNDYKSVKITAFDAILKINENLGDTYSCSLTAAKVTPLSVIKDICSRAGIAVSIGNSAEQKSVTYKKTAKNVLYSLNGQMNDSHNAIGIINRAAIPSKASSISIRLYGAEQTDLNLLSFRAVYFKDAEGLSKYSYSDYDNNTFVDVVDFDDDGNVVQYVEGTITPPSYNEFLYLGFCFNTTEFESLPENLHFEVTVQNRETNYVNSSVTISNPQKVDISPRDMLGYMAGILGCNAVINRSGALTLKKLTQTPNYIPYRLQYMGGLEKTYETVLPIEYITTGSSVDESGNGGTITVGNGSYGFNFENPYITSESVAQNILNLYKGLKILPCNVNYRGNPSIDSGDIISVQDKDLKYYNVLAINNAVSVTGGLSAKIDCGLKTDVKQDFISVPSSKRIEHKVDSFISSYQDVINELVGIKGGYVQQVRDADNVVRALAITQSNIQVVWDEANGKVVTLNLSDKDTPMWVWSYGGLSYTNNGGYSYNVAINMNGEIYAERIVGKLSEFVELQAKRGTIGGWNIEKNSLYSDYDYETDSNGNNCYRVYLQNAGATNKAENSWAISVQQGKKDSNGFSGTGKYVVQYNGKCFCSNGLDVTGVLKMDSSIRDSKNRSVVGVDNNNGYFSYGYGAYASNYDGYYEGNTIYLRYKTNLQIQDGATTRFTFNNASWKLSGVDNDYIKRNTITTPGGFVLNANDGNNGMYLVASTVYNCCNTKFCGWVRLNFSAASGTIPLVVNTNGQITTATSSERYKENITQELEDWLNPENLYTLPVVQYNYKEELKDQELVSGIQIGITAEGVHEHYPNACIYNDKGEPESWQDRIMIPAMLKLIQKQKSELDELQTEQNNLIRELSDLKELLTKKGVI